MALRAAERATRIARQNAEPYGALHVWCEAMLAREPETPKMRKYRIAVMTKAFGH
jgi:acetyl-CoA carboxylase alpha subunit